MDFSDSVKDWFISGITWQLFWEILMAILTATGIAAAMRLGFDQLMKTKQLLYFWGGMFLASLMICIMVGNINQRKPNLVPEILQYSLGNSRIEGVKSIIIVSAIVTNTGNMPSIARNWQLQVLINGEAKEPRMIEIPDTFTVEDSGAAGEKITYFAGDALYNKALNPIPPGGATTGILLFGFPNIDSDVLKSGVSKITLKIRDATLHQYSAELNHTAENMPIGYVPGIKLGRFCPVGTPH